MKKKTRFLSTLLACTMVLSMAGCGSNQDTTGDSQTTSAAAANTASGDQVTITFWDDNAGDERTEYYQQLIANFEEKNPDIHIEYLGLSSSDALSKYQTAIAAGETPDVGGLNNGWASTVIGMGHCVALDDYMTTWDEAEYMDEGSLEVARAYSSDGKLYMLPNTTNFMCLWVNDQMFADAGVEIPTTWDDFFAAVEKLTDKEKGQYGYTIRGGAGAPSPLFDLIYAYMGTTEVFDENGKCTVNSDKAVEFVEKFLGMYGVYTPESDITAAYKETSANFDSGVSAMFNHNLGSYGTHVAAFGGTEGFEAAPFPMADNGKYINFGGSINGPAMFDTCENKEAAWKWISYLCSHEGSSYWNQSIGQLPTNTLVYEDAWVQEQQHVKMAVEKLADPNTETYTSPGYLPEWGTINSTYIEPAIQSVMSGEMTAKEMLDMWADYLTEAYADYTANK